MIRYRFDQNRRPIGTTSPVPGGPAMPTPRAVRYTYNANGDLIQADIGTVPDQSDNSWITMFTTYNSAFTTYDNLDRPVSAGLESGGIQTETDYNYDTLGRLNCTAVRMDSATFGGGTDACSPGAVGAYGPDRISQNGYDADSHLTSVVDALTTSNQRTTVSTMYTANGNAEYVADAKGNTTSYTYDGFDRLSQTTYPDSATDYELLGYDANSNVTSLRMRDGNTITYQYDALNRRDAKGGAASATTYTYDNLNRLTDAYYDSNPSDQVASTYDALSRLTSQTTLSGMMSYQYDAAGNRTQITWPDAFYVNYQYDLTGQMTYVQENGATSGVGVLATYGYDGLGRKGYDVRGNGTTGSYSYDSISRLMGQEEDLPRAPSYNVQGLTYSPASQLTQLTNTNSLFQYTPPANVGLNSTFNGLNQITNISGSTVTFDARGNMTALAANSYGYDQENHLTSVADPNYGFFAYDPLGRMEYKTASGVTERLLLDDTGGVVGEVDLSGTISQRWVPGAGTDERVAWYNGTGTTNRQFLAIDAQSSVTAVTNSSGGVVGVNTYDPYGVGGTANIGAIAYTGQYKLIGLALDYYKARIYSPAVGQFLQTDPAGYDAGMNLYAYVEGDPINQIDATGLATGMDCKSGTYTTQTVSEALVCGQPLPKPCVGIGGCTSFTPSPQPPPITLSQQAFFGTPPNPAGQPKPQSNPSCRVSESGAAKALGIGGNVQDGMTNMSKGILRGAGQGAAGELAEKALGPLGIALSAAGQTAQAFSDAHGGLPVDIAIVSAVSRFGGGLVGGGLGATGGAAAGAVAGLGVADAVTIPVFTVGGGAGGAAIGEAAGGLLGNLYKGARGYGGC